MAQGEVVPAVGLAAQGFMNSKDAGDAKGSKIPQLAFDYMRIIIQMPTISYSHDFIRLRR